MVAFKPFSGGDLTLGSYVELHRRNSQLITAAGAEKLRVTSLLADYNTVIGKIALRVNSARSFAETPEVTRLDQERDATQKFCYWTIIYASGLPRTSALYAAAQELAVVARPYKSIAHHELTRQTTETAGFVRDLKAHPEALATLGLTTAAGELETINIDLAEMMGIRETVQGDRTTSRGEETTDQLRKQTTSLLEEIALRINAAAIYLTDDPAIPKLISDLNGVADHYRQIASQGGGGNDSAGTPANPATPANPGTTTDPGTTTEPGTTTDPGTTTEPGNGGGGSDNPNDPGTTTEPGNGGGNSDDGME